MYVYRLQIGILARQQLTMQLQVIHVCVCNSFVHIFLPAVATIQTPRTGFRGLTHSLNLSPGARFEIEGIDVVEVFVGKPPNYHHSPLPVTPLPMGKNPFK